MTHLERITPIVKLNLKLQIKSKSLYDYSDAYILVKLLHKRNKKCINR